MGYDGKVSEASVDPNQPTASQKIGLKMVYNFGVGVYDVTITSGPSYNTLRAEAAESMTTMVQARPELMNVIGDLMVKNMDWPGADEIAKRLHMTLPPPILQAEQQEKQNQMPPEMQQIVQQFDMAIQQKDQMLQQATSQIQQLMGEMQNLKQGHDIKVAEVQIKAQEAETNRLEAETARAVAMNTINAPQNAPPDTYALDRVKLEFEDRWKRLEADTKILVANIAAEAKNYQREVFSEGQESTRQAD
jgi:hypothetical protein